MNLEEPFGLTEKPERERHIKPPIIDVFRHAETWYKELTNPNFKLDPDDPHFALDADHLDLTEEGIANIRAMAEQLANRINKDDEMIMLVVSPQMRARSSMLIIEDVFLQHGIIVMNSAAQQKMGLSKGTKISKLGLGQILINQDAQKSGLVNEWIKKHGQFIQDNPDIKNLPPAELHKLVADYIGIELSDIYDQTHAEVEKKFSDFIRHLINIEKYLSDNMKSFLDGKQLRIISVTHEERLAKFANESLGSNQTVPKGNLLEIIPQGPITKDEGTEATVSLYGQEAAPTLSSQTFLRSSENGLKIE